MGNSPFHNFTMFFFGFIAIGILGFAIVTLLIAATNDSFAKYEEQNVKQSFTQELEHEYKNMVVESLITNTTPHATNASAYKVIERVFDK